MRLASIIGCLLLATAGTLAASAEVKTVRVERLLDAPINTPETHPSVGNNIQGPSLIKVPDWLENRLGRYYLYFADHKGRYIRLAFADDLLGPWQVYPPGSLQIEDSYFPSEPPPGALEKIQARLAASEKAHAWSKLPHSLAKELTAPHIASPDVHVDEERQRIIMYFHGLEGFATQLTRVALSSDGIRFKALPDKLGLMYLRTFQHAGMTYGIAMPGRVYRSTDGLSGFEEGPLLFNPDMRHCALLKRGNLLYVFWTQVGHVPERIVLSTIDLSKPWMEWKETEPAEVLRPERDWEGADEPLEPSIRSVAYGRVNQLRAPAVFEENDCVFLLYAVAGESGIAIAEVFLAN